MSKKQRNLVEVTLLGEDGNIFNLLSITTRALKRKGFNDEALEMTKRVYSSKSYSEALSIIYEYVEEVPREENEDDCYWQ